MKKVCMHERLFVGFLLLISKSSGTDDLSLNSLAEYSHQRAEASRIVVDPIGEGRSREEIAETDSRRLQASCSKPDSHSWLRMQPVQMKATKSQGWIKLMGVYMEPNVTPEQIINSMGHTTNFHGPPTQVESHGITTPSAHSQTTTLRTTSAGSSPVPKFDMSTNQQLTRPSIGLKFDYDLFHSSPTLVGLDQERAAFLDILKKLGLGDRGLRMTAKQLVDNQQTFMKKHCKPRWCNSLLENFDIAQSKLFTSLNVWAEHWRQIADFDWMLWTEGNTKHTLQLRTISVTYLFFVEMISTIVPEENAENNMGSHLSNAVGLLDRFLNPAKTPDPYLSSQLIARANRRGSTRLKGLTWRLIACWMETFRPDIIIELHFKKKRIRSTQLFSNFIFYHSITPLTDRLRSTPKNS